MQAHETTWVGDGTQATKTYQTCSTRQVGSTRCSVYTGHTDRTGRIGSRCRSERRPFETGTLANSSSLQYCRMRSPVGRRGRTRSAARLVGMRSKSQLHRRGTDPWPSQRGPRQHRRVARHHCFRSEAPRRLVRQRRGLARCRVPRREMRPRQRWTWWNVGPARTQDDEREGRKRGSASRWVRVTMQA